MHMSKLHLTNNPWISPPTDISEGNDARKSGTSEKSGNTRLSPTVVLFKIPPLSELCLRVLLAPSRSQAEGAEQENKGRKTVLEALYALPLSGTEAYPTAVLDVLRSCLPAAVAKPALSTSSPAKRPRNRDTYDVHTSREQARPQDRQQNLQLGKKPEDTPSGFSVCPSPIHRTADDAWVDGRVPVFVQHAEERFTWEQVIAGLDVGSQGGPMGVPVRWRGCGRGCLDFLDVVEEKTVEQGNDHDHDVEMDLETEQDDNTDGVQVVDLGTGGLGDFEDFE